MVECRAGEWIQSMECIFLMKVPWRITAPMRSREKGDEFSQ